MPMVDAMTRMSEIKATLAQFTQKTSNTASAAAFSATLADSAKSAKTSALADPTALATSETAAVGTSAPDKSASTTKTDDTTLSDDATGADIVKAAKKYLGVPYVFGGESTAGMDCSGLVQKVLDDVGIASPRLVHEQQNLGTEVRSLKDAKPGDLIVTNNADHIVIYAGNGKIIHAPYPGRDVCLRDNYLTDADIQTIRRVAPEKLPETQAMSTRGVAALGTTELSSLSASLSAPPALSSTQATTVADLIAAAQLSLITGKSS